MSAHGTEYALHSGSTHAVITAVGAGLRQLSVAGVSLTPGFRSDVLRPYYSGTVLMPWTNRVRDGVTFCAVCGNVSDAERCRICGDPRRDASLICVVEEPKDVQAVERTREFRGRYHVLGGALDPLSGIGPDQLRIRELLNRIGERVDGVDVAEIIIATDPNTEGEATATYLVRMLRDIPGLTVTRIASGLPMGGDLEFADELTLGRALAGRRAMA